MVQEHYLYIDTKEFANGRHSLHIEIDANIHTSN